jgi:hypothetical protein
MTWDRLGMCTLGALLLVGSGASCSSGPGSSAGGSTAPGDRVGHVGTTDPSPGRTGSVGLALTVPGGITINQVSYVITGPTPGSSTVDVSAANSVASFVVGGLSVGAGYAITLSATDTAGDPCSSSPAPFSISFEQTTQVSLSLVCTVGDGGFVFPDSGGAGSLQVGASVTTFMNPTTVCPVIASFSITPATTHVGTSVTVSASTNPSGASVTYSMLATDDAGAGMATLTGNTLTCTAAGQVELTATTTAPLANDAGNCPPQSASAFIDCEP